jgi:hypothetical protein
MYSFETFGIEYLLDWIETEQHQCFAFAWKVIKYNVFFNTIPESN